MRIIFGLFANCVLQRTKRNRSDAHIRLQAARAGTLRVRITKNGRPVPGFGNKQLTNLRVAENEFQLAGLPVGGPYRIELTSGVRERLVVKNVLVGDVWLAAGQSNMQGVGLLKQAAKPTPMVRAFYMDDRWAVARDPIHNLCACVDQVHIDLCGGARPPVNTRLGTGPAVAFAQEMWRRTGVPQGVIACAHGGTSMDQWNPAKKSEGSKSLYGAMLRRFEKNGGRCAGMIWYQGESDALAPGWEKYTEKMVSFVRVLRRDTRQPDLPVALVQLGRVLGSGHDSSAWNSVQDQQRQLPKRLSRVAVVPAIDLQLDDSIHIGGADNNRLGRRLAQAMCALTGFSPQREELPIALRTMRHQTDPASGLVDVIVEFDNVVGRLTSASRPAGFTIRDAIHNVRLEGARAILKTVSSTVMLNALKVSYGSGADPYCNITDEADRSVPVFGAVTVGKSRAFTPFIRRFQATTPLPGPNGRVGWNHPGNLSKLPWRIVETASDFCDVHGELSAFAPETRFVYFKCRLQVPEPMRLAARLGYDGPVKLWLNGRELFHDQAGTNPAAPDKAIVPFTAPPGEHTILVALSSNAGRAWGIYLRFERRDLPQRVINKGPQHYRMPSVVS